MNFRRTFIAKIVPQLEFHTEKITMEVMRKVKSTFPQNICDNVPSDLSLSLRERSSQDRRLEKLIKFLQKFKALHDPVLKLVDYLDKTFNRTLLDPKSIESKAAEAIRNYNVNYVDSEGSSSSSVYDRSNTSRPMTIQYEHGRKIPIPTFRNRPSTVSHVDLSSVISSSQISFGEPQGRSSHIPGLSRLKQPSRNLVTPQESTSNFAIPAHPKPSKLKFLSRVKTPASTRRFETPPKSIVPSSSAATTIDEVSNIVTPIPHKRVAILKGLIKEPRRKRQPRERLESSLAQIRLQPEEISTAPPLVEAPPTQVQTQDRNRTETASTQVPLSQVSSSPSVSYNISKKIIRVKPQSIAGNDVDEEETTEEEKKEEEKKVPIVKPRDLNAEKKMVWYTDDDNEKWLADLEQGLVGSKGYLIEPFMTNEFTLDAPDDLIERDFLYVALKLMHREIEDLPFRYDHVMKDIFQFAKKFHTGEISYDQVITMIRMLLAKYECIPLDILTSFIYSKRNVFFPTHQWKEQNEFLRTGALNAFNSRYRPCSKYTLDPMKESEEPLPIQYNSNWESALNELGKLEDIATSLVYGEYKQLKKNIAEMKTQGIQRSNDGETILVSPADFDQQIRHEIENVETQFGSVPAANLATRIINEDTLTMRERIERQTEQGVNHLNQSKIFRQGIKKILHPTALERYTLFQARGIDMPEWFPGMFFVYPNSRDLIPQKQAPDFALLDAWHILAPVPKPDVYVVHI